MEAIASQITSLTSVYSVVYSDADQRKHQSSASLAFVWGIHRGPVNSPHKWPVTRKMFPFDDVIMSVRYISWIWCDGVFEMEGHHWFEWLAAKLAARYYLNQRWLPPETYVCVIRPRAPKTARQWLLRGCLQSGGWTRVNNSYGCQAMINHRRQDLLWQWFLVTSGAGRV